MHMASKPEARTAGLRMAGAGPKRPRKIHNLKRSDIFPAGAGTCKARFASPWDPQRPFLMLRNGLRVPLCSEGRLLIPRPCVIHVSQCHLPNMRVHRHKGGTIEGEQCNAVGNLSSHAREFSELPHYVGVGSLIGYREC